MKKKLSTDTITNELEGASLYFAPRGMPKATGSQPPKQIAEQQADPVREVPPVRPVPPKRIMKSRHPFDIYRDQYEALQELALKERLQGGAGSMSAMVREGLDLIIARKRKELEG